MRWQDLEESQNVEDRRGARMGGGFPRYTRSPRIPLRSKTGLAVIAIVVIAGFYGIDLTPLITGAPMQIPQTQTQTTPYQGTAQEQELAKFSKVALKTTEEVWTEIFRASGQSYQYPRLVLYSGSTNTACGYGESAMGPFIAQATISSTLTCRFIRTCSVSLAGAETSRLVTS